MKMITKSFCKKGSKNYKRIARKTSKALRMWKKKNMKNDKKLIEVKRYMYKKYAMIDFTYTFGNSDLTGTVNYFYYC